MYEKISIIVFLVSLILCQIRSFSRILRHIRRLMIICQGREPFIASTFRCHAHTFHVWHPERLSNSECTSFRFLYKPILDSLELLLAPECQVDRRITSVWDLWLASHMRRNDIFIYVGDIRMYIFFFVRFRSLRRRGIYCIYFQTEPIHLVLPVLLDRLGLFSKHQPDEIWDYAALNLTTLQKLDVPSLTCKSFLIDHASKLETPDLIFLGNIKHRQPGSSIFLNIHKVGATTIEALRINKLLGHKALIISEPCEEIDRLNYNGLVFFEPLECIPQKFDELVAIGPERRQKLADEIYASSPDTEGRSPKSTCARLPLIPKALMRPSTTGKPGCCCWIARQVSTDM
ncbi:hypothetical protein AURANDRAFT_68348 [Aureococcus anophagefferens]|nr:hypothetical protein AURANDRAFT_68348 [Aureococcus anophagefferens]EGB03045.1 hypothetical protein AURANDRAFT_68348 [Aureococcus anophagefferens]|eukprot:XP_009042254.1 hypothetical protein AURANDRAFT_68348 [Aureococcus anophagefferens]